MSGTLDYDLLVTMLNACCHGTLCTVKVGLNFGLVGLMLIVCNACPWNEFKSKDDSSLCIWQKNFASVISTCYRKWAIPVN